MAQLNAELGNRSAAIQQLERVIFFGEGKYDAKAFELLGQVHLQNSSFTEAADAFNQSATLAESDSAHNQLKLFQASALIRAGNPQLASIELLGMQVPQGDSAFLKQQFLLGITQFTAGNFGESRASFRNAAADTNAKIRIDSLFDELSRIKHPNAKTARLLSIVFPGAGQFYAGDVKNGINSMLLTGGFVALGYFVATRYSLLDATVAVIPWIQRYYMGGFKRAGLIAEERLKEKQDKIYRRVLKEISF
jgi:hypothetical protein